MSAISSYPNPWHLFILTRLVHYLAVLQLATVVFSLKTEVGWLGAYALRSLRFKFEIFPWDIFYVTWYTQLRRFTGQVAAVIA